MRQLLIAPILPKGDVCHVAKTVFKPGETSMEHDHDFFEIFLVQEGTGWHGVNGRRIAIRSGNLVLIRPADRHSFTLEAGRCLSLTNVAFPVAWFEHIGHLWPYPREIAKWTRASSPPMAIASATERAGLEQALLNLAPAAGPRHLLLARFCIEALQLLRPKGKEAPACPPWLEECVLAMEKPENLQRDLLHFQRLAGRSPEHLARLCRAHFGLSPTELLNRARIRHAQRRLLQSEAKVVDIAYDCGFENLGYFHRVFSRLSGCTPRHWRLRHPASAIPRWSSARRSGPPKVHDRR